jgi:periplasmic protein TonB
VSRRTLFVGFSLLAHGVLAVGVGEIEIQESRAATAIEIAETQKKKPPPPEPAKIDPKPEKPERMRRASQNRPAPLAEAKPAPELKSAPLDALPDFGLSLSGSTGGTGIAVPAARGPAPQARSAGPVVRRPVAAALQAAAEEDGCADATRPKPKAVPQPAYSEAARAAGVEGKVRVQLTVDETGKVVSVRVLQGLGYGLDEAAVAAANRAQFEPATRCGKPVSATFTISMRFTAS